MVAEAPLALPVLGMGEGHGRQWGGQHREAGQPVTLLGALKHHCIQAWLECEMGRLTEPQLPGETQGSERKPRAGSGTEA